MLSLNYLLVAIILQLTFNFFLSFLATVETSAVTYKSLVALLTRVY